MTDPSVTEIVASGVADALDGAIDVTAWTDLAGLPDDMTTLGDQFAQICDHARRWMCRRDGFEPSPVCLLRPLAELVDLVADALDATEQVVRAEWVDLTDGVVETTRELRQLDAAVADRLPLVR